MEEEHKVWIRGVNGRGNELIEMLVELGAKNTGFWECNREELIYYINHDGYIDSIDPNCELGKIIMDNYTELHLPEKWKDGDVLVSDEGLFFVLRGDFELGVKKEYAGAYCCVSEHQICLSGHLGQIGYPHLASPSEVEHFHELMHKYGKDWDAEKKQVVDWKWKLSVGDMYYIITTDGNIKTYIWNNDSVDKRCFNFGNCFRIREEAEAMLNKIKKLLNAKS